MKKIVPVVFCLLLSALGRAQNITWAHFVLTPRGDGFQSVELELDEKYLVGISGDWDLQYIEVLRDDADPEDLEVKYYDNFDIHEIPGRVKSIGDVKITYTNSFDIHDVKGMLKSIGDLSIKYYNTFDIHDVKGKVKSIGDLTILYYNKFDRDELFGRFKGIEGNSDRIKISFGRYRR